MVQASVTRGDPGTVVRLLQGGKFDEAHRLGVALLHGRPRDPMLLQLTGLAALEAGAAAEGIDLLRRAYALRPDDAVLGFNLAKALGDAGSIDEALKICPQGGDDHLRLRAELASKSGRPGEARAAYEQLVVAEPNNAELRNNLANAYLADDDPEQAITELEHARALDPALGIIHLNLAKAYGAAGRADDALAAADEARRLMPDDWRASVEQARALTRLQRPGEALPVLIGAFERNPGESDLLIDIGLTFVSLGEFGRAEDAYRLALQRNPAHPAAVLNLGNLLEQDNRLEELAGIVRAAENGGLDDDGLKYLKAQLARRRGDLQSARDLVESVTDARIVTASFRAQLIGQIADRQGDYATAFEAFAQMNAATRASQPAPGFRGDEYRNYIAGVRAATTPEWWNRWTPVKARAEPSPAFLVGFPRSGTTLLDTVLMGHPGVHVLEEEPVLAAVHDEIGEISRIADLSDADVVALRGRYFDEVAARAAVGHDQLVVDKLPLNLMRTPLIHRLFPDARFILALRHPCDSVLSCFMQNFRVNRAMASFWTIESSAETYAAVFDFWEHCRRHLDLAVHTVRYEELVDDLAGTIQPLVQFLGLEWDPAMLDFQRTAGERAMIQTPSYAQVTEKLYQRARGRWENYRAQMAPALPVLAPWAERHGYGDILTTP